MSANIIQKSSAKRAKGSNKLNSEYAYTLYEILFSIGPTKNIIHP